MAHRRLVSIAVTAITLVLGLANAGSAAAQSQPSVSVDKTATPLTRAEPGGPFTYNVVVTNTGNTTLTTTSLTDDQYGNLNGQGTCATGASLPTNGSMYSCSFTANFFGNAGAALTDTVNVTATAPGSVGVGAADQATVSITDVAPTIDVIKTADPSSRVEPGGTFTFDVIVVNTSFEQVTITSMLDDVYGDLASRGTCGTAVGTSLAANGGSYSCSFSANFTGNGGDSQTDIVTVRVVDDDESQAFDSDAATVSITSRPISVVQGNTTQTNTQTSTTNQTIDQSKSGGGIVVFGGSQNASNESDTALSNSQSVGGTDGNTDSIVLGDTNQTNAQSSPTEQQIHQDRTYGPDPVIFGGSQRTHNGSSSHHSNSQSVGGSASATAAAKRKAKAKARAKVRAKNRARARARAAARAARR